MKCHLRNEGTGEIEIFDDIHCGEKPEDRRECLIKLCEGLDWITSEWTGVSRSLLFLYRSVGAPLLSKTGERVTQGGCLF